MPLALLSHFKGSAMWRYGLGALEMVGAEKTGVRMVHTFLLERHSVLIIVLPSPPSYSALKRKR